MDADLQDVEGAETTAPSGESDSMLDELRRQHQALVDEKELTISVPGYNSLVVKYRLLNVQKDLKAIRHRVSKQYKDDVSQALWGSIDTMIAACLGLYYQRDDGELLSLGGALPEDDGSPVTYADPRLVEFFAWPREEIKSSRDVVMHLFGFREPMIISHGQVLAQWMQSTSSDVNEDFSGNL